MADVPAAEFAWSPSRDRLFRRCPRQYFLHYHGARGGWSREASSRVRTLYVLKQLRGRKAWAGENVHDAIHGILTALREGKPPPFTDLALDEMLTRMRSQWRESGEGDYWNAPQKHCALWEHEYDIEIADAEWKATVDHALACIRTFLESETFRHIRGLPTDAWLDLEDRAAFDLAGQRILVQLDFAHRDADGIVIHDWKTGRADKASTREQLACYILYAAQRWNVPPDRVTAREFNLGTNTVHETRLDAEQLAATRERIAAAAAELAAADGRPEEAFPFAEDETTCHTCNFLRVCPKWLEGADDEEIE